MGQEEVFERRFWKSGEEKKAELEVLEMVEGKMWMKNKMYHEGCNLPL